MRAAAIDFRTARLLGVRANRVIGGAVLISGVLAAVVAVMLTVQTPLVTPDFALDNTIVVLAGVVLGGLNRPIAGDARRLLRSASPAGCSAARCRPRQSQYLPSFLFAAVIVVLLVRPERPLRAPRRGGARMRRAASIAQLACAGAARRCSRRCSARSCRPRARPTSSTPS